MLFVTLKNVVFIIRPNLYFQPLMVVCNKTDVIKVDDLPKEKKELLKVFEENNTPFMSMSTLTEEGVAEVKEQV